MLSPSYLESLPVGIVDIYSELESSIIADISRRIAGIDGNEFRMTGTAEWQIKKAMEMRLSQDEIAKQVARALGKSTKEVKQLFKDAGIKALESDSKIYALAGKDPTEFMNSIALNQTLQAGIKNTNGLMSNFCRTTANTSNKLFEDLLDRAYLEVNSGAFSYQQAIQRAIRTLGVQGLQTIRYPSGHTDQVDVAVRRAVVTGINQTCARLQLDLANEMDCDLVEVTSHFGARPSHADWQGGIYSISGKHRHYKGLAEATGYGSGDGLCGWHCRHNFYPFFEGISVPLGNPHNAKESEEYYNNTQKQRSYERRIRSTKRQVIALESAISVAKDNDLKALLQKDFTAKSVKLKQQEQQLKQFLEANNLMARGDRIKVSGFGKSQAQKATMAAKKQIEKKVKELEKLQDLKPPRRNRHYIESINSKTPVKPENTIIMPGVDVNKDIADIKKGLYTRLKEEYTVNGRTYKHHGDRFYPVSGDGFITLDGREYNILKNMIISKDSPKLEQILNGLKATESDINKITKILKEGGVM